MTLAIIGAGMAGLACADRLAEDGIAVRLLESDHADPLAIDGALGLF